MLIDGTPVANGWADLTDGTLINPINLTAEGETITAGFAWTGTAADGTARPDPAADTCFEWTALGGNATVGDLTATTGWTDGSQTTCFSFGRLYCFAQ